MDHVVPKHKNQAHQGVILFSSSLWPLSIRRFTVDDQKQKDPERFIVDCVCGVMAPFRTKRPNQFEPAPQPPANSKEAREAGVSIPCRQIRKKLYVSLNIHCYEMRPKLRP